MKNYLLFLISSFLLLACNKDKKEFSHPFQAFEKDINSSHWIDIEGMKCRDGSPTGIGVKVGNPKKLAIYINGGGACFNMATCASNPSKFDITDWNALTAGDNPGIFSNTDSRNPLKDYTLIFVPYCTGDVHSGTKNIGFPLDSKDTQRYVGAFNFIKVMDFITPYFEHNDVEEIVLFGLSAGGYGVYINFLEVINRFKGKKITVINDSGPLFSDPQAFPPCLQAGFTLIFGLPLPEDLLNCCGTRSLGLANVYEYSSKNYPDVNFGFMSSYEDATSRYFLSFGYNNCTGAPDNQLPSDVFKSAIKSLRDDIIVPKSTWSTYYISGDSHTMLADNYLFYEKKVEGMYLYEWVSKIINGERLQISEE